MSTQYRTETGEEPDTTVTEFLKAVTAYLRNPNDDQADYKFGFAREKLRKSEAVVRQKAVAHLNAWPTVPAAAADETQNEAARNDTAETPRAAFIRAAGEAGALWKTKAEKDFEAT